MSDNKIVMRSKALLSIVVFLTAFGISVALTPRESKPSAFVLTPSVKRCSANTEAARKITALLSRDVENGLVRDRKLNRFSAGDQLPRSESFAGFAAAVDDYARASNGIDDANLPSDFKAAWRRHMNVWQEHSEFLIKTSNSSVKVPGNNFASRYSEQNAEISETWYEVLRVAREYDAYIPPDAY